MLYTRTGDSGTSGLFGTKERFPKESLVYDALGTLDELNSLLGVCYAVSKRASGGISGAASRHIRVAQEMLFVIQAELAGAEKCIVQRQIYELESAIDRLEDTGRNPHSFVLSGATEFSGLLDYARAVSRRAERTVIAVRHIRALSALSYAYLNRLSSLLYALARDAAATAGATEGSPSY